MMKIKVKRSKIIVQYLNLFIKNKIYETYKKIEIPTELDKYYIIQKKM